MKKILKVKNALDPYLSSSGLYEGRKLKNHPITATAVHSMYWVKSLDSRPKNKCQFKCTYVHKKNHQCINVHWIHIFSTFWHGITCQLMKNTINLQFLHQYWLNWTQLSKMGPLFKISAILSEKLLYVQASFSQKMANFRSFHEKINVSASLSR